MYLFIKHLLGGLAACAVWTAPCQAQQSSNAPYRIVVPWAAGTGTDLNARAVAKQITAATGVTAIVENRPGANGVIGSAEVLRQPADGHTILATSNAHVANPYLMKYVPYDGRAQFTPIGGTRKLPAFLLSRPGLGVKSIDDLTALAKLSPGKISFGAGTSSAQIALLAYQQMAGITLIQITYKSATDAMNDLLAGHST